MEKGFLIEITISGSAMYLYLSHCGVWDFTTDSIRAMRFSRKIDAKEMCRGIHLENVKVTEHQWGG